MTTVGFLNQLTQSGNLKSFDEPQVLDANTLETLASPELNTLNSSAIQIKLEFFERSTGQSAGQEMGSGAVLSPDGLVVSNCHVANYSGVLGKPMQLDFQNEKYIQARAESVLDNAKRNGFDVKFTALIPKTSIVAVPIQLPGMDATFWSSTTSLQFEEVPLRFIASDPESDLAMLVLEGERKDGFDYLKIASSPDQGFVHGIGHPHRSKENFISSGEVIHSSHCATILATRQQFIKANNAQTAAVLAQTAAVLAKIASFIKMGASTNISSIGNSGGPLVDGNGELQAIMNGADEGRFAPGFLQAFNKGGAAFTTLPIKGLASSIPINKVVEFLERQGVNIAKLVDGKDIDVASFRSYGSV
ncbi:MAG: trypsin-like peptidase domain-containing protein [Cyanobacteria bacterium]|nr:trypsin-like peptidase domain-containing protein [Cyanobacteriota bacterium]